MIDEAYWKELRDLSDKLLPFTNEDGELNDTSEVVVGADSQHGCVSIVMPDRVGVVSPKAALAIASNLIQACCDSIGWRDASHTKIEGVGYSEVMRAVGQRSGK